MPARLVFGASLSWLGLLALAAATAAPLLTVILFKFGSFICHQQPARSFHWDGGQWAVCARCLGLYAAAPAGALLVLVTGPGSPTRMGNLLLLSAAAIPTAATWSAEHMLGWPMSNAARFGAALPLGAAVAFVVARTLQYTLPDVRRG